MTTGPIVQSFRADHLELPSFRWVEQRFAVPPAIELAASLQREWRRLRDSIRLTEGDEVAVAVGSRGIDCLSEIVCGVVEKLREAGCRPFIVPAMGSHGGASATGQVAVLADLGVTEERVGAPIRASMEVDQVGAVDGLPLVVDRLARHAAEVQRFQPAAVHKSRTLVQALVISRRPLKRPERPVDANSAPW